MTKVTEIYDKTYYIAHKLTQFVSSRVRGKQEETKKLIDYINEEYKKNPNIKVLDMGCDEGRMTHLIKEKVGKDLDITGIDINEYSISQARKKYNDINFEISNDEFVEKNEGNFDIVFSAHVLEHVDKAYIDSFINNKIKLLKENGTLVIIIPQERIRGDLQIIPMFLNLFKLRFVNPHVSKFTKQDIEEMMDKKGFKLIDYIYTCVFPPYKMKKRRIDSIGCSLYFKRK